VFSALFQFTATFQEIKKPPLLPSFLKWRFLYALQGKQKENNHCVREEFSSTTRIIGGTR
jgi:hypothetical protein